MQNENDEEPVELADVESVTNNNSQFPKNEDLVSVPIISYWKLFKIFMMFGFTAWGGPASKIDMFKQQLVIEQKWISVARFQRTLALYQALPGPEATELCCYFGMVAKGRIGSVVAGLGFMLPGFCLMLLFAYLYDEFGIDNKYAQASFRAVQPCVTALVFPAVKRLSEDAFQDMNTNQFSYWLFLIGCLSALQSVLRINFFITLAFSGLLNLLVYKKYHIAAVITIVLGLAVYILYVVFLGFPGNTSFGVGGVGGNQSLSGLFLLGLFAGLLTFGGAYTAIPFLQQDAVVLGGWMTNQQFLDGLAIGSVLPSPLVIISTFVGYIGGGFPGAFLMTIGMFLPAFLFTLIGHQLFERLVKIKLVSVVLDGITACVIGLIFITAFQLLKAAVSDQLGSVLFVLSLMCLEQFKNKYTIIVLVLAAATVGQVLYVD